MSAQNHKVPVGSPVTARTVQPYAGTLQWNGSALVVR